MSYRALVDAALRGPVRGSSVLGDGTGGGASRAATVYGSSPFASPSGAATQQIEPASGTVPTVFVAASDARQQSKDAADLVCDGVADHEEFQAAADELNGLGTQGRIVASAGTFNVGVSGAATGSFFLYDGQHLMGMGYQTVIRAVNNAASTLIAVEFAPGDNCTVSSLRLDGNKANNAGTSQSGMDMVQNGVGAGAHVFNVWAHDWTNNGIRAQGFEPSGTGLSASPCVVRGCKAWGCDNSGFTASEDTWFVACQAWDCTNYGISLFGVHTHAVACQIASSGTVDDTPSSTSTAAIALFSDYGSVMGCRVSLGDGIGILHASAVSGRVANNTVSACRYGIVAADAGSGALADNAVEGCDRHGYWLRHSSDMNVSDNRADGNSTAAANTYDGFLLDHSGSTTDDNKLTDNMVRGTGHRYGINVSTASCNRNIVRENDVRGGYTTGGINDAGTGTVTTVPAGGNWV